MKRISRDFPGTTSHFVQNYEKEHRKTARKAAAEGMVLLKNENQLLPLQKGSKIALYGAGACKTIKGGIGSGDVNTREVVSIYEGLHKAGFKITTQQWLKDYEKIYDQARFSWREAIWEKTEREHPEFGFFDSMGALPFVIPEGEMPEKTDTDTAIFVLARTAGEGADRYNKPGDYLLSEGEERLLKEICSLYPHVIFLINAGGLIDLSFMNRYSEIESLLYVQQPGMEGGNAVADVISGGVTPSGKLTDTWAFSYSDYPNAATFSHNDGDVQTEVYTEGIYVGYRYFDTFQVPVRFSFGYGLSYTDFEVRTIDMVQYDFGTKNPMIGIKVQVTNSGKKYSGREVIQIYASCPLGKVTKEYRRLVGFQKTGLLAPGETEIVEVKFPVYLLASYDEKLPGWVLENGCYGFFTGNSLSTATFEASLMVKEDVVMVHTENICAVQEPFRELDIPEEKVQARRNTWKKDIGHKPSTYFWESSVITKTVAYGDGSEGISEQAAAFVDTLTQEQLIQLATGAVVTDANSLGSAGAAVPGSAAQTSTCAQEQGLASIVLADGPAGLRLSPSYQVEKGQILPVAPEMTMENGFFCKNPPEKRGTTYYQYTTAIPVGTLLAQTWDVELVEECGKAVAEEMQEFGITLWLAPGMNIHRNPLCGRNFEYYSEDPVVSGRIASAITKGVQSEYGCGTTIKHFACNNQEDNRMKSDSRISERALREIYLKGFEIAVAEAAPKALMTSYNLINGIHAANHYDLCTKVLREEWGFQGLIMTDWTTTQHGKDCTASGCMRAGNDIVMPGALSDHDNLAMELRTGALPIHDLKRSIGHLVDVIWASNQYEHTNVEKDN